MHFHGHSALPHSGNIESCLYSDEHSKLAVISEVGKAFAMPVSFMGPINRLALYNPTNVVPFAVFDACRYKIQDIVFHDISLQLNT